MHGTIKTSAGRRGADFVDRAPTVIPTPTVADAAARCFDYAAIDPALATEARAAAEGIRQRLRSSIADTGRDLLKIKEKLPHGSFGPWLKAEFDMSERTAQNYMNAAGFLEGKSATVAFLPPAAVYALAAPSADPAVVTEVLAEIEAGTVPKSDEIRGRLAGASKAKLAAAAAKAAEQAKKDRENERRRKADAAERDRKRKEEEAADNARREARAMRAAEFLIARLGSDGVGELSSLLRGLQWSDVVKHLTSPAPQATGEWIDMTPANDIPA